MKYDRIDLAVFATCGALVLGCVGLIVYLALQPSCEERGGTTIKTGYRWQTMMVGKVPVTQMVPTYACIGAIK